MWNKRSLTFRDIVIEYYCCCFENSDCCFLDKSILPCLSSDHERQEAVFTQLILVKCNISDSDKSSNLNDVTEAYSMFSQEFHTYDTGVCKNNNDRKRLYITEAIIGTGHQEI